MSEFKDRIRLHRDEFIQEDRRGSYKDFGIMKKQIIKEFFNDDPLFKPSVRDHEYSGKHSTTGNIQINKIFRFFYKFIFLSFTVYWSQ